jgi:hypothetical protein
MLLKKACEDRRTVIPLIPRYAASEAGHDGAADKRSEPAVLLERRDHLALMRGIELHE